jgi:glycosyltransferase involved in cell wall biosynthesis
MADMDSTWWQVAESVWRTTNCGARVRATYDLKNGKSWTEARMKLDSPRRVSVVIIAQDEQSRIANAVRSCEAFADEIVMIDGGSRDDTVLVARDLGCKVFVNDWPGYASQRNFGAERASHDWIFFVDADEVVGEDLAAELCGWKKLRESKEAYAVYHIGNFFDKRITGGYAVRLYNKRVLRVKEVLVHESVEIEPDKTGRFSGILWHHGFRSVSDHVARFNRYTDLEAQKAYLERKEFSLLRLLLRPPARFAQRYLLQKLYRQGIAGLTVAVLWSYYEFSREIKLYETYWRMRTGTQEFSRLGRAPSHEEHEGRGD